MRILRSTTLALVVALLALTLPAVASAAPASGSHRTRAIGDCVHPTVMPRKVISACADVGEYAVVKRYGSWGARQAMGSGRLHVNDCTPTCAAGTFHSYRATFRFHRVVKTAHGPVFTRLGVTYVKGGEEHDTQLSLPRHRL